MSTEAAETTGRTGRTGPDTTVAGTAGGRESAAAVRSRIDDLDARIIALVQERRAVAVGDIRRAHAGAGESRTAESARTAQSAGTGEGARTGEGAGLAREMEILNRYRGELGRPGTQLAMTLLALCRAQP
ncbi:chorismate mutase [Streptomyces sp. WMMB 322]|uniref:chorismate mutase n=1 Tax=Streptomyces sp. WMMB 322 TaxID=1286821 RepID=UPI000823CAC3|nr:chorismate mutase [Streptomyces sp. WMMB 322]SCK28504.1 chorismate mutase [Streptomyces sp. WMMB 322]